MSRETSRARRPFKVWDSSRATRKALVVSSLEELIVRGRDKLGIGGHETVRVVLETDGTQVDDSEYFRSLPENTVFLLLRPGDRWCPAGIDVIRAALSSIPRIVCEAISSLDLQDEVPSWKIMEQRGRITIVLTWDHRTGAYPPSGTPPPTRPGYGGISRGGAYGPPLPSEPLPRTRTMLTKDGKYETVINDYGPKTPTITVISHEEPPYDSVPGIRSRGPPPPPPHHGPHYPYYPAPTRPGLPRQGSSSLESGSGGVTAPVHIHTVECAQRGHVPQHPPHGTGGRGSPPEPSYCDFHCCALHEEGRKIQVHKTVATSPIQEGGLDAGRAKSLHVRFKGLGDNDNNRFVGVKGKVVPSSLLSIPLETGSMIPSAETTTDSSESETENNQSILEEEKITTQKFLLLIDQLSLDQKRHLTVKDIGVILERLSSKIVDVERLDRETEAEDCYNWTIKATIRGEVLTELGVIYNGNFYAISEHPNYQEGGGGGGPSSAGGEGPSTSGTHHQPSTITVTTSAPIPSTSTSITMCSRRGIIDDDDEDVRL